MNPQIQNQDNKPANYEFILNQSTPEPKPHRKKLIIVAILAGILIVVLIIAALISSSEKVQPSQTAANGSATVQSQQQAEVIEEFFKRAHNNDIEGAYEMFATGAAISKDEFTKSSFPFLRRLKLDQCQLVSQRDGLVDDGGRVLRTYACPSKKNNFSIEFEFSLVENNGSFEIYYYNLAASL